MIDALNSAQEANPHGEEMPELEKQLNKILRAKGRAYQALPADRVDDDATEEWKNLHENTWKTDFRIVTSLTHL